jgi:hypothetical protein
MLPAQILLNNLLYDTSQLAIPPTRSTRLPGHHVDLPEIGYVFDVDPADVKRLVRQALDSHKVPLDDSHVVADVSGSTVTLIGPVRTGAQRDAVVRAAWRGHAVMAVVDQIEITG